MYEDAVVQPLLNASRDLRIKTVEYLDELIATIHGRAQAAVDRIEKAKKIADSLS
jgi:hypothetical protein